MGITICASGHILKNSQVLPRCFLKQEFRVVLWELHLHRIRRSFWKPRADYVWAPERGNIQKAVCSQQFLCYLSIPTASLLSGSSLLILGNHILKVLQVLNFVLVHSIARNNAEGDMTPIQCSEFTKKNGLKNDKVTDVSNFGQCRFIHQRSCLKLGWAHLQMMKNLHLL